MSTITRSTLDEIFYEGVWIVIYWTRELNGNTYNFHGYIKKLSTSLDEEVISDINNPSHALLACKERVKELKEEGKI